MNQLIVLGFKILAFSIFVSIIISFITNLTALSIGAYYINHVCEYNLGLFLIVLAVISILHNTIIGQIRINIPARLKSIPLALQTENEFDTTSTTTTTSTETPNTHDVKSQLKYFYGIIFTILYILCLVTGSIWIFSIDATNMQCNSILYNFTYKYIIGTFVYWGIVFVGAISIFITLKWHKLL